MDATRQDKECKPSLLIEGDYDGRMTAERTETPRRRRRGPELEQALLQAAWDELVDVGFARLTMESVAARAKTGVGVLYRRWPNKDDMVLAALTDYAANTPAETPDTGSLREDIRQLLHTMNDARSGMLAVVSAAFAGLHDSSGYTPAAIREQMLHGAGNTRAADIFARAAERGEIDLDHVPQSVLDLPFDLVRHDLLMRLERVGDDRIDSIVDDIFWPLVTSERG